jgi:nitrogen fixation/metabolism regulation signal transduction histidine kinase
MLASTRSSESKNLAQTADDRLGTPFFPLMLGNTEHRLALVVLVTALLPLASAMLLAYALLNYASSVWLRPEIEQELQHGIDLYKDYLRAVKDDMKDQTAAIAENQALRDAARRHDATATGQTLAALFPGYARLVSLAVEDDGGRVLASHDRERPLDDATERKLEVRRALSPEGSGPKLLATFAFDRRYEQELERAGGVHDAYARLQKERANVYAGYYEAFAVLLGITVVATVALGFVLARGITRRINRIANAIKEVTAGRLDVRVPVTGSDELTELARVFNRMLSEMQQSRARIEYLQRIGAWQEMAQRLAHEIKNPLTPIQLAVQECHRKYAGADVRFRALLDTTLEIVEEEVGTLRRLVGNFSSFARLPHADLREASLRDFLRECSEQLGHLGAEVPEDGGEDMIIAPDVDVLWELPNDSMPVAIDRQMLRRVLVNLVRNAVEAIRGARRSLHDGAPRGHVIVRAEQTAEGISVVVEDDGPGVPEATREKIFDPYFTTKPDGTGLGLAIVKKVVVEHNGSIAANPSSRLGGAALVVTLPFAHSLAIAAARDEEVGGPRSGRAIPARR